jgi:bacillithiol biosynthesis cysteine-adding enzyme BshC
MTEPVVRTEPIGGSPLARAAVDGGLTDWYAPRPTSAQGWIARVESIRAATAAETTLAALRPALAATGAAAARLDRVRTHGGVVVTTGQQPGLFGGPVYTWSKALSALALADEIEATTGVAAAPVFWAANDDADFAEACWTAVAVQGGAERLAVSAAAPIGRPMSEMPLGNDVAPAIEALVRACGATIDSGPLDAVRAAYRAGETVGGAYLVFLRRLFEPLGIAVLDASHASVAVAARPFLLRALERAQAVTAALRERDDAITGAGFTAQVTEVAGLSLVFERPAAGGEKRRVPLSEAAAVAASGETGRATLSPNVLLRPVIERAILPTVAYVAGPGEIAYFAQVGAVAGALDLEAPLAVPRWSTTIIEPHIARILARLQIDEAELADPHRAEGRVARESLPPAAARALNEFRAELGRLAGAVSDAVRSAPLPVPADAVDGAHRAMRYRLERLERRIVASVKRRDEETMTQIGTARGALFPLGTRQERALNIIPFIARHGPVVTERMLAAARDHARELVGTGRTTEAVAGSR